MFFPLGQAPLMERRKRSGVLGLCEDFLSGGVQHTALDLRFGQKFRGIADQLRRHIAKFGIHLHRNTRATSLHFLSHIDMVDPYGVLFLDEDISPNAKVRKLRAPVPSKGRLRLAQILSSRQCTFRAYRDLLVRLRLIIPDIL